MSLPESTHLLLIRKEEDIRIHSIGHSRSKEGEIVKDDGWLRLVLEEKLLEDIDHDAGNNECGGVSKESDGRKRRKVFRYTSKNTHLEEE